MKNKVYNVEIEILTPVHIGDGNTISGIDYFCYKENLNAPYKQTTEGKIIKYESFLYKFNIQQFIKILEKDDKIHFTKLVEYGIDTFEIRNFIYKILEEGKNKYKKKFITISKEKIYIKNKFYDLWKEKIKGKIKRGKGKTQDKKDNEFTNQLSQLQIKSFIKSLGRYYIPGSSLKGAIRTILINENKDIEHCETKNDTFKKLIVRDSNFIKNKISIGNIARQKNNGEGQFIEFLKPGIKVNSKIIIKNFIDELSLKKIDLSKDKIISESYNYINSKIIKYIEELIGLKNINNQSSNNSMKEMKNKKIDSVIESFNKIKIKLDNLVENECILNIGFGGGYWFKSFYGDEKYPNENGIKNLKDDLLNIPRTTNNIDLENLGFIKLTFTD